MIDKLQPINLGRRFLLMVISIVILLFLGASLLWEMVPALAYIFLFLVPFSVIGFYKGYKINGTKFINELRECNVEMLKNVTTWREDPDIDLFIRQCLELNQYLDRLNYKTAKRVVGERWDKRSIEEARKTAYKITKESKHGY